MGKKKAEMKVVCKECGEEAPIDKEKSNGNWTVHKTKEPCKCGGKFGIDFGGKWI